MGAKIDTIVDRLHELEEENKRLKLLLEKHGISYDMKDQEGVTIVSKSQEHNSSHNQLSLQEKVDLFRSLFKGREDVFAKRWYSNTTNQSGYQPVCGREWNRDYCDKRKYKCVECPNRQFSSLSYEHVYNHLAGKDEFGRDVIGIYPILEDNTCHFLCTDFDDKNCEHGYQNDVLAFVGVCKDWNVPCYIERSRSGMGAHVWIFFDAPIPVKTARMLGKAILTEAMKREVRLSFKSYDRFFPNQDILPEGGLGNLVALPLQGKARRNGNSVFVDETFNLDDYECTRIQGYIYIVDIPDEVITQSQYQMDRGTGSVSVGNSSFNWIISLDLNARVIEAMEYSLDGYIK